MRLDLKSKEFRAYRTRLDSVVQECYLIASNVMGWSVEEWAKKAGLHYSTVYNLLARRTNYPFYLTVFKLAESVGCEVWVKSIKQPTKSRKAVKA